MIGTFVLGLVGLGTAQLVAKGLAKRRAEIEKRDLAIARRLGLHYRRALFSGVIKGNHGSHQIRIHFQADNNRKLAMIVIRAPAFERSGLRIGREPLMFGGEDIESGDKALDDAVRMLGSDRRLLSVLDMSTRQTLLALVTKYAFTFEFGVVRMVVTDSETEDAVVAPVRSALEFLRRLGNEDIPTLLAANARGDPQEGVRRRNLQVLVARYPEHPATLATANVLLDDLSPRIRLIAAQALPTRVTAPHLEKLAVHRENPDDVRAEALRALAQWHPYEPRRALVLSMLRDSDAAIATEAAKWIRRERDADAVDALCQALPAAAPRAGVEIARTLATFDDARAESALLSVVTQNGNVDVSAAACHALARIGTLRAVEALMPLTKGLMTSAAVKEAAREAVSSIHARNGDPESGEVSIAGEVTDGAVSLSARSR